MNYKPESDPSSSLRCLSPTVSLVAQKNTRIESSAVQQLQRCADLPGVVRAAGLPDLHPGRGYPIGAAFLTRGGSISTRPTLPSTPRIGPLASAFGCRVSAASMPTNDLRCCCYAGSLMPSRTSDSQVKRPNAISYASRWTAAIRCG